MSAQDGARLLLMAGAVLALNVLPLAEEAWRCLNRKQAPTRIPSS